MDFEDILKDVGGFGTFQKVLVLLFLFPTYIVLPWFSMNPIFATVTPDHWCHVPEVASSNLSLDAQKLLIRPSHDSSCSMYDVNYSQILLSGNLMMDTGWPTKKCSHGWQYDTNDYAETAVTKWNMVCEDSYYASLTLSLIFIGNVVGTPFYGFMSDRLGRRPTFLILAALTAVTEVGAILSPNFILFLLFRALNGSPITTIYAAGLMILLELANPSARGAINFLTTTSFSVGLCLLPLVAYLCAHWIRLSIFTSSVAASLLLFAIYLPESPRWLISQRRYKEAAAILEKVGKMNGRTSETGNKLLEKIQKIDEMNRNQDVGEEKAFPTDFFKYPNLRKIFILFNICWIGTAIPYYGLQIIVTDLSGNQFLNFFLVSVVEIPSHLITLWLIDRIGRRWCCICGFVFTAVSSIIPIIFASESGIIAVVASVLAKAGASSTFMSLYQQGPELFPTPLRCVGMAMSSSVGTGTALLGPYITYLAKYGTFIPFICFAAIAFVGGICALFLPETLNRTLPQTIADAESLKSDFNLFCCIQQSETNHDSEKAKSSWKPTTLSPADLSTDLKNILSLEPDRKFPVVLQQISSLSDMEINQQKTLLYF